MLIDASRQSVMITGFVAVTMLLVEYLNVLSAGVWQRRLAGHTWGQYLFAGLLGATPGCLGAFAVVALYSHGVVSLGAVVAAMIATSGDESFVMLALIPKQAPRLFGTLLFLGIVVGALTDRVAGARRYRTVLPCEGFETHIEELCECFPRGRILHQWRECAPARGILTIVLALLVAAFLTGGLGPPKWNWIRVTLVAVSALALFIVATVPDHFLEKHLWDHVFRRHVPRVFLWTLGALIVSHLLTEGLQLQGAIRQGKWIVLVAACLIGLIPESGPHLVFVTLYAQGVLPLSVLLASSVVQDGHGMLPVLADSRREFLQIKAINLAAGTLVGAAAMSMGY